jgi:hypothetical protein
MRKYEEPLTYRLDLSGVAKKVQRIKQQRQQENDPRYQRMSEYATRHGKRRRMVIV